MKTVAERLASGTAPPNENGCCLWTKAKADTGYGVLRVGGKLVGVHRLSYQINVGPIPPGMFVLHACDVRACISPGHLRVGTNSENVADAISRGRFPHGETHQTSKLKDAEVEEIRRLLADGVFHREIASRFRVSRVLITNISTGKRRPIRNIPPFSLEVR